MRSTQIMALHHRFLLDTNSSTPAPSNVNRTREAFTGDANFDTNMVIILAALLCALICALGLNSIVRCALRCSRRFAFETPEETAARLVAKGLKKSALHQIPIVVYGSGSVGIAATDCPICLGEFLDGEKVRVLPKCNHGFHVRCIDTWLLSHSSCPNCRQSLLEQPTISGAVGAGNSNYGGNASAGQEHVSLSVASFLFPSLSSFPLLRCVWIQILNVLVTAFLYQITFNKSVKTTLKTQQF